MSENTFQTKVIKYIESHGGYVVNMHGGTLTAKGTPDLIVCWRGRFLALELKTKTGSLMKLQSKNISWVRDAGGYARRLRENEWESFKDELKNMIPV